MEVMIWAIHVIKLSGARDGVVQLNPQSQGCLISPTAGNIHDGVASPSQHNDRHPQLQHILDSLAMRLGRQIKVAQLVMHNGIRAALQHDHVRAIHLVDLLNDALKHGQVHIVGYARLQRDI